MTDDRQQQAAKMLENLRLTLFRNIANGRYNFEEDYATLQRYLKSAHDIGNIPTTLGVYVTFMLLYVSVGRFEDALATLDEADSLFTDVSDPAILRRRVSVFNNRAQLLYDMGEAAAALATAEASLAWVTTLGLADALRLTLITQSNLGSFQLAMGQLDAAAQTFQTVLNHQQASEWQYGDAVLGARIGMAEIALQRGMAPAAHAEAAAVLRLSRENGSSNFIFAATCTLGHLADAHPTPAIDADQCYTDALAALASIESPMLHALPLLHEARYQHHHGHRARAAQFAHATADILRPAGITRFDAELATLGVP